MERASSIPYWTTVVLAKEFAVEEQETEVAGTRLTFLRD